jgi:D-lactate dehydrogenase
MTTVAFYDTKPYDRQFMVAAATDVIHWVFHEFRLTAETAATARGADAVCVFVNDRLDGACLEELAGCGIRHVALRCAGFNNVDLVAAGRLGFVVTAAFLQSLGIDPHAREKNAVLYREDVWPQIKAALVKHIEGLQ